HPRRHRHRLRPRADRGADQGVLPGGLRHRDLHHHGHRASAEAGRPVRQEDRVMATMAEQPDTGRAVGVGAAAAAMPQHHMVLFALLAAGLVAAPLVLYPVFVMKVLCFALFACAFNLLLGYGGLLSFGHAAYFGSASYISAHAAKVWGLTPELAILAGTGAAALLGLVFGSLSIRRSGIYYAMVTLASAQMIYFFSLQAECTGGEDGIQAVPRGKLFGVIGLGDDLTLYYVVL